MSIVRLIGRRIVIETTRGARIDISSVEANEIVDQLIDLLDEVRRAEE